MSIGAARLSPKGVGLLSNPKSVKVGQTPHEVVYKKDSLTLKHYLPRTKRVASTPLLVVYALVNRPYILDLLPERSVVAQFLDGGIDLYLIDWGVPGEGERDRTLSDYISGSIHDCLQAVKHVAGSEQVSLFGYCQGGTFSAIYTALHPKEVKNLILLAAPFDFSVNGLLNLWSKKTYFDVDKLVDTYGNIPASILNSAFIMLRPIYNGVDKYVQFSWSLSQNSTGSDEKIEMFCAMEKWLSDGIPHPGEVFREFVKGCYQDNLLIQNKMRVGKERVNLKNIQCPVLSLIAEGDHIIPPESSRAIHDGIASTDQTVLGFASGHVGLTVGAGARKTVWPKAVQWLVERS